MFNISDYILTIATQGSFSKAAAVLHISQPALSMAVKKLEATLGQPLFQRHTAPLQLTTAGELYVAKARQIAVLQQSFTDELHDLEHHLTGTLTLGGAFISVTYLLPPLLKAFHQRYPDVQLSLLEMPFPDLTAALLQQQIDLAVDTDLFLNPKIASVSLFENHVLLAIPDALVAPELIATAGYTYAAVVARKHVAATAPTVDLANFAQLPFILMTPANEIYQRTAPLFTAAQFKPQTVLVVNQQISAYTFVQQQWGGAFVTDTLIQNGPPVKQMHFYKLKTADQPRHVAVSFWKQHYQPKRVQAFIAFAQAFYSV